MLHKTKARSYVIRVLVYFVVVVIIVAMILEQPWKQGSLSISNIILIVFAIVVIVFPFPFDVYYEITEKQFKCKRRIFLYSKTLTVPLSSLSGLIFNDTKKDYNFYLNERAEGVFHDFVPDGTSRYARNHWVVEYLEDGKKHYIAILPDKKLLQLLKQNLISS